MKQPEDAHIVVEKDMQGVETLAFHGGQVALFSTRSPGKETPNEDSAAVIPFAAGGILVVADGAGGTRGGGQASSTLVYEMLACLEQAVSRERSARDAILNGLESANREINTLGIGAATTAAVVELCGEQLRPYHVGDSGILLVGQKGKLKFQSLSHAPTAYAVESGFLDEDEALGHEDRHLVSNIVGIPEMRIELGAPIEISSRDTLLVASDGLFDNLTIDEIVEILRRGSLEETTQELVDLAQKRMLAPSLDHPSKPDDLTLVTYRLDS